jgi:ATP-binding cassette subfamily G (WHITE) protein 1
MLMDMLYWRLDDSKSDSKVNDRNGSLFFIVNTMIYANLHSTIVNFPLIREVFLKEYRGKMYGVFAFYLAKNLADLIAEVALSVIFGISIYWAIGYNTDSPEKPVIFLILLILTHMSGTSLGLLAGCWFKRLDIALSMGSVVALPFYYFSGYIRQTDTITVALRWIADLSVFRWGFDGLILNQYHGFDGGYNIRENLNIHGSVGECIAYLTTIMLTLRIVSFIGLRYNATR